MDRNVNDKNKEAQIERKCDELVHVSRLGYLHGFKNERKTIGIVYSFNFE